MRTRLLLPALLLTCATLPAAALGRPDWAKPHLDAPSPAGTFIAKNDRWAVVYEEVEFGVSASGKIEARHRSILENLSDKEEAFSTTLEFDSGAEALSGMALNVERAVLWHSINLTDRAVQASEAEGSKVIVTGEEVIPAHHRVVWEYTLTDLWGFLPWCRVLLPERFPVVKKRILLDADAARRGLTLRLVRDESQPTPQGVAVAADGSVTAERIPAFSRMPWDAWLQPDLFRLYPYALALYPKEADWKAFAAKYAETWNRAQQAMDAAQMKARAEELTRGLATPADKARRLARFVQIDVRYDDANEKGMDAWVPLQSEELLRSMKGDCKGKVMLLQKLLEAVGIRSVPILLRNEPDYYTWLDNAGTAGINHVVMAVELPELAAKARGTLVEGPAKGWILFDPTQVMEDFGGPTPGFEGVPALFLGTPVDGPFLLSTRGPSLEATRVVIEADLKTTDQMVYDVTARDGGASPLLYGLTQRFSDESMKERIARTLSRVAPRASILNYSFARPADDPAGECALALSFIASQARQELTSTSLLANPLGAAAAIKGFPEGLARKAPEKPEDHVDLVPPWDARLNAHGAAAELDVDLRLQLPDAYELDPPKNHNEKSPWLTYVTEWTKETGGAWRARVHISLPRGEWPAADRKAHLQQLDAVYRELHEPLMLKKK